MGLNSFTSSLDNSHIAGDLCQRDSSPNCTSALDRRIGNASLNRPFSVLQATTFLLVLLATFCSPVQSASIRGVRLRRTQTQCNHLNTLLYQLDAVRRLHQGVFAEFKGSRFANPEVTSANIIIPNLPSVNDFFDPERVTRSVHDRLPEYYQVLLQFKSAFEQLKRDEVLLSGLYDENNLDTFEAEFEIIIAHMDNCIASVDRYVDVHGLDINNTLVDHPVFDNAEDERVISTRNLRVLEEFQHCVIQLKTGFLLLQREGDHTIHS